MERDDFLARVRHAAGRAVLPEVPLDDPGLLVPDLPAGDLVDRFTAALTAANGVAHTDDPVEALVGVARSSGASTYMSWDDAQLPHTGLTAALDGAGLARVDGLVGDNRPDRLDGYLDLDLGLTGALAAFAESGSIVVASGPGRPRMASLIPAVHVAVLRRSDIHRSLAHWAAGHADVIAAHTNVVFISGPSRTGDIEMKLNIGVHGPKELHVILV